MLMDIVLTTTHRYTTIILQNMEKMKNHAVIANISTHLHEIHLEDVAAFMSVVMSCRGEVCHLDFEDHTVSLLCTERVLDDFLHIDVAIGQPSFVRLCLAALEQ